MMHRRYRRSPLLLALLAVVAAGCVDDGIDVARRGFPLAALCSVDVIGKGSLQMESDYLPHVVACENGNADIEALKVQAVTARSYAYYKVNIEKKSLKDGTGDQVYSCSYATAEQKHYDAVAATAGQVLTYRGGEIAAFYVAGAIPSTADCVAAPHDSDETNTERYVTYNEGKTGDGITQTSLGWVDPSNDQNRGCASQEGANCLSLKGWRYEQILRFYYGADIGIERAIGPCVAPPAPDSAPPPVFDGGTPPPQPDTGTPGSCDPALCGDIGGSCCGERCVILDSDPNHCGGCGVVCARGQACEAAPETGRGRCVVPTAEGGCQLGGTPSASPLLVLLMVIGLAICRRCGRRRGS